jgi:hypothetical protein
MPAPIVGVKLLGRIIVLRELPQLVIGIVTPLLVFLVASVGVVPDDWNRAGYSPGYVAELKAFVSSLLW